MFHTPAHKQTASFFAPRTVDFDFVVHGSLITLSLLSDAAQQWASDHIVDNGELQYWGHSRVLEPRYFSDIFDGMTAAGLTTH